MWIYRPSQHPNFLKSIHLRRILSISWVTQLHYTLMISIFTNQQLRPSVKWSFTCNRRVDTVTVLSCTQFTVSADYQKLFRDFALSMAVPTCSIRIQRRSSLTTRARLLASSAEISLPMLLLLFATHHTHPIRCWNHPIKLWERFAYWTIQFQKPTMLQVFRLSYLPNSLKEIMTPIYPWSRPATLSALKVCTLLRFQHSSKQMSLSRRFKQQSIYLAKFLRFLLVYNSYSTHSRMANSQTCG